MSYEYSRYWLGFVFIVSDKIVNSIAVMILDIQKTHRFKTYTITYYIKLRLNSILNENWSKKIDKPAIDYDYF